MLSWQALQFHLPQCTKDLNKESALGGFFICHMNALNLHRQNHHLQAIEMQTPLNRQCRLVMQQASQPIVRFENQFAGKENRVRVFLADLFAQLDDLADDIRAEAEIGSRRHAVALAEIDEILECRFRFRTHVFYRALATVSMRVNGTRIHENEILKVAGEHAQHPQQRMQAATTGSADYEYRRLVIRIRRDRTDMRTERLVGEHLVHHVDRKLGFVIVVANVNAQAGNRGDDDSRCPTTLPEFLDDQYRENAGADDKANQ